MFQSVRGLLKALVYLFLCVTASFSQPKSNDVFTKIKHFLSLSEGNRLFVETHVDSALKRLQVSSNYRDLYNTAYLYYLQDNIENAELFVEQALNASRNDDHFHSYAYFLKSKLAIKRNNLTAAIPFVEKAIDIENDYEDFHFALGDYLTVQKKYEKANEAYEDGLDIDENHVLYHVKYAKNLIRLNQATEAIEYLEKIYTSFYPEDDLSLILSDLYLKNNQQDKAENCLKTYLYFYPNGHHAAKAKEQLFSLGKPYEEKLFRPELNTKNYSIQRGEKLTYYVYYLFKLGHMNVDVDTSIVSRFGHDVARVTYTMYSSLINFDAVYEVYIDTKTLNSVQSIFYRNSDSDIDMYKNYIFDAKHNLFKAYLIHPGGRLEYVEKELPNNTQDGTGLLYYTRGLVANEQNQTVTTVIDEHFKRTDVTYFKKRSKETALGKTADYIKIHGKAHYQGVAGMTGDADGWFSIDGNFVPLVGKMSIIVGSVRVELEKMSDIRNN